MLCSTLLLRIRASWGRYEYSILHPCKPLGAGLDEGRDMYLYYGTPDRGSTSDKMEGIHPPDQDLKPWVEPRSGRYLGRRT